MAFKIGFAAEHTDRKQETPVVVEQRSIAPRKSVVQVAFPGRGSSLAYYNDQFDLRIGDIVYVDGKLEGQRGRVVNQNQGVRLQAGHRAGRHRSTRSVLQCRIALRYLRQSSVAAKPDCYMVQGTSKGG